MKKTKNDLELITISELSELTKISTNNIYRLTSKREIPFVKIGKSIRFQPTEINKWLKSQSVTNGKK